MKARLLVSNLDKSTTEDELDLLFSRYGEILSIDLSEDPDEGRRTYSAVIEMSEEEAEYAIEKLQGYKLNSLSIKIEWLDLEEWDDEEYDDTYDDDAYEDDTYEDDTYEEDTYEEDYDEPVKD